VAFDSRRRKDVEPNAASAHTSGIAVRFLLLFLILRGGETLRTCSVRDNRLVPGTGQ
jgi:hypothetical protein